MTLAHSFLFSALFSTASALYCLRYRSHMTIGLGSVCLCCNWNMRGSQKVPGINWHRCFGAPWFRTAWTELLVIYTWKFCRGSGETSGRQGQWFLHHDNVSSHTSLVVQQFLSSPNHRTLQISLRMNFAVPYSENLPEGGHDLQLWRTTNRKRLPNSRRMQK
jgi:hypothetical protein